MAITLNKELSSNQVITFSRIEFDADHSSFVVKTHDEKSEILVKYTPIIDREFEDKLFDVHFFSNQYLNAENDVFEVYEKEIDKRIGWIFPIQVLDSNENDFADNKFLNKYKFPVFSQLLKVGNIIKPDFKGNNNYRITDFFNEEIIVFVVSIETLPEGEKLNILNYLPCFASFGYYLWNNDHHQHFDQQQRLAVKKRGHKKINIRKASLDISQNQFLTDLYYIHLKSINHFLLKFYFLYQVIEFLMEENFNNDFNSLVDEYKENYLSKNDLKERINSITRERGSISSLFGKSNIPLSIKTDFKRDCKALLENYYSKIPEGLGDLIYDTRNLVVHRYREIMNNKENVELLELVTHELELIINELIITYSPNEGIRYTSQ